MDEELKPCPVCGQMPDENWYGNDRYISCQNEDCMLAQTEFNPEAWNNCRPNHTEQPLEMVTLRDRYAMAALTGLLAHDAWISTDTSLFAKDAFAVADQMMKQRKARETTNDN